MPETGVASATEFEIQAGVPRIRDRMAELTGQPGLTKRQCYHNLQTGIWPGVHQGGKWTLRPHGVLEEYRHKEDDALAARRARLAAAKSGNGGPHAPEAPRRRGRPRRKLLRQQTEGQVGEVGDG